MFKDQPSVEEMSTSKTEKAPWSVFQCCAKTRPFEENPTKSLFKSQSRDMFISINRGSCYSFKTDYNRSTGNSTNWVEVIQCQCEKCHFLLPFPKITNPKPARMGLQHPPCSWLLRPLRSRPLPWFGFWLLLHLILQSWLTKVTKILGRSFFSLPYFSVVTTILIRSDGATSGGANYSVRSGSEKAVKEKEEK